MDFICKSGKYPTLLAVRSMEAICSSTFNRWHIAQIIAKRERNIGMQRPSSYSIEPLYHLMKCRIFSPHIFNRKLNLVLKYFHHVREFKLDL